MKLRYLGHAAFELELMRRPHYRLRSLRIGFLRRRPRIRPHRRASRYRRSQPRPSRPQVRECHLAGGIGMGRGRRDRDRRGQDNIHPDIPRRVRRKRTGNESHLDHRGGRRPPRASRRPRPRDHEGGRAGARGGRRHDHPGRRTISRSTRPRRRRIVEEFSPEIVVPMHYKSGKCGFPIAPVDEFTMLMGDFEEAGGSELDLTAGSLPAETEGDNPRSGSLAGRKKVRADEGDRGLEDYGGSCAPVHGGELRARG